MTHFVCTQVDAVTNACTVWVEQVGMLPALTAQQGFDAGAKIFGIMAIAWGVRFLCSFIYGRF